MKKRIILIALLLSVLKTEAQVSVFNVVDSLLQVGNYQNALKLLENDYDKNLRVYEKTGDIYQIIGNYNKAIVSFSKAIKINPKNGLKTKLANVYSIIGYKQKAIDLYEEVFSKDSANLLVANSLGKLYLKKVQPKSAEKIYLFLKDKDSLNPNYPYQLGKSLALQKKIFPMGKSYIDAFNLDTLHLNSIYEIAKFFKVLKTRDTSRIFIEKGLKIDSTNINFLQLKANDQYFSKQFPETIETLKKLVALNFKSLNTYEMYGMSYFNLEKIDSAEVYFKKALRMDQKNPKILYRLASVEFQRENFKKAKFYNSQAILYSKPDLDKQYMLMGTIAKEENNLKEALSYFDKAYKNNYYNFNALFELALTSDAYYEDKKIAFKYYEKYLQKFESKNVNFTKFAKERIKDLTKRFFIDGVIVD